jgi:DNA polymerase I-like protein with 3'-5' exonuclease and polymerase domains
VKYTESRNTPFQGDAADGAKAALWELYRRGARVVAFIHDEILIEVRTAEEAEEWRQVMVNSMSGVLNGFPVTVATTGLIDYWGKP